MLRKGQISSSTWNSLKFLARIPECPFYRTSNHMMLKPLVNALLVEEEKPHVVVISAEKKPQQISINQSAYSQVRGLHLDSGFIV